MAHGHRFTPTRVGITCEWAALTRAHSVHPHARGDHSARQRDLSSCFGSPPRAWGSQLGWQPSGGLPWFTPTRVGITPPRGPDCQAPTVHPHARGDHRAWICGGRGPTGSPPRAWGSPPRASRRERARRFTPTRVGITLHRRWPTRTRAVHPHARGDHVWWTGHRSSSAGSPPRAWGSLHKHQAANLGLRFTPTRVGITSSDSPGRWKMSVHPHARGDHHRSTALKIS